MWSFKGKLKKLILLWKAELFPGTLCLCFLSQLKQMNLLLSQISVSTASLCFNSSWSDYFCAFFFSSLKANEIIVSCRSEKPGVCDYSTWEGGRELKPWAGATSAASSPQSSSPEERVDVLWSRFLGDDGKAGLSRAGRTPASWGGISPPTAQKPIPWLSVPHMGRNFSWEEKVSEISCCRCYADFNLVTRRMKYLWLTLVPCLLLGRLLNMMLEIIKFI